MPDRDRRPLCRFKLAWRGMCQSGATNATTDRCATHAGIRCRCGEPATQECDQGVMGFVCGGPVCDRAECRHDHLKTTLEIMEREEKRACSKCGCVCGTAN